MHNKPTCYAQRRVGTKLLKAFGIAKEGWSLLERLVTPWLKAQFVVKRNSPYNQLLISLILVFANFTGKSVETASEALRLNDLKKCPVGRTLRNYLAQLHLRTLQELVPEILAGIAKQARRARLFTKPVMVAIDPHDDPFYGKQRDIHVIGSKPKAGTAWFYSWVPIDVIEAGMRFTLDFVQRTFASQDHEIVNRLLRLAKQTVNISLVLLDCEFYSVKAIKSVMQHNLRFIMPAPNKGPITRLKKACRPGLPTIFDHEISDGKESVKVKLVLMEHEGKILAYITNFNISAELVRELYRLRWGIETDHRVQEQAIAMTTSVNPAVRFFNYLLSVVLRNIWVLANLLAALREGLARYIKPRLKLDNLREQVRIEILGRLRF